MKELLNKWLFDTKDIYTVEFDDERLESTAVMFYELIGHKTNKLLKQLDQYFEGVKEGLESNIGSLRDNYVIITDTTDNSLSVNKNGLDYFTYDSKSRTFSLISNDNKSGYCTSAAVSIFIDFVQDNTSWKL